MSNDTNNAPIDVLRDTVSSLALIENRLQVAVAAVAALIALHNASVDLVNKRPPEDDFVPNAMTQHGEALQEAWQDLSNAHLLTQHARLLMALSPQMKPDVREAVMAALRRGLGGQ